VTTIYRWYNERMKFNDKYGETWDNLSVAIQSIFTQEPKTLILKTSTKRIEIETLVQRTALTSYYSKGGLNALNKITTRYFMLPCQFYPLLSVVEVFALLRCYAAYSGLLKF